MTLNINWLWVSRIAKVLALLLFFMPWLVVSCNGQPLMEASGWQLATGNPTVADTPLGEMPGQGDQEGVWWVWAGGLAIILGLLVSFVLKPVVQKGRAILGAGIVAVALLGGGMAQTLAQLSAKKAEAMNGGSDMDEMAKGLASMMGNAIQIEIQACYWTVLCLLGLAIVAAYIAQARPAPVASTHEQG